MGVVEVRRFESGRAGTTANVSFLYSSFTIMFSLKLEKALLFLSEKRQPLQQSFFAARMISYRIGVAVDRKRRTG